MSCEEAIEVERLFVNARSVFSYLRVDRCDFVYRYDFVYMLQLNLKTGALRPLRRLEFFNM